MSNSSEMDEPSQDHHLPNGGILRIPPGLPAIDVTKLADHLSGVLERPVDVLDDGTTDTHEMVVIADLKAEAALYGTLNTDLAQTLGLQCKALVAIVAHSDEAGTVRHAMAALLSSDAGATALRGAVNLSDS